MLVWICIIALVVAGQVDGEDLCTESSYGTDFIFGFMDMPYYASSSHFTDPTLSIRVTCKSSTSFYVTLPSTDSASKTSTWNTKRHYVYRSSEVSFNSSFINRYQTHNPRNSIRITSTYPIAVLAVYSGNSYVVTTPVLPVAALSSSYALPSYPPNTASHSQAQVLVIALHGLTSVGFEGYDLSTTITLNQNESYVYQTRQDISGTSITSNHPVAVFTYVTQGYRGPTTFLSMQVPPFGETAVHFIVPALPSQVKSYKVRIYAASQEARVEIHSTSSSTTQMHVYERTYYEYSTKGSSTLEILSDNPVMVVQIALGSIGENLFMTNIPAVTQYLSSYLTDNPYTNSRPKYFVLTIRHEEALGLLVGGKPALHNPDLVSHRTPLGNYTVFTIPMTSHDAVSHVGDEPFGLFIFGSYIGSNHQGERVYGHSAGLQFKTDCPKTTPAGQIVG